MATLHFDGTRTAQVRERERERERGRARERHELRRCVFISVSVFLCVGDSYVLGYKSRQHTKNIRVANTQRI